MIGTIISNSNSMAVCDEKSTKLFELAKRVARTDVTVYINGPTEPARKFYRKLIHTHSKAHKQVLLLLIVPLFQQKSHVRGNPFWS